MAAYADWNQNKIGMNEMIFYALNQMANLEKANILANRIIVNALQSERGDIIRAMNAADLEMMKESVFNAVDNKRTVKAIFEYGDKLDSVIEEEVGAFFEIDGKLQYREVPPKPTFNPDW